MLKKQGTAAAAAAEEYRSSSLTDARMAELREWSQLSDLTTSDASAEQEPSARLNTEGNSAGNAAVHGAPVSKAEHGLRAKIFRILRGGDEHEGLHVDDIAKQVQSTAAKVRLVCAELEEEGYLFSTITEEHFAVM